MTTPEIEELKILLEEKYNKALTTTTDFDGFSLFVQKKTNQCVSPSTLKRLWGYVSDSHKPRTDTLDRLAMCLGHKNYRDFVQYLKTSTRYNSSFFAAEQLSSGDIADGSEVSQHEVLSVPEGVEIYEIDGPFFFGVATKFDDLMRSMGDKPVVRIIRMRKVPFIDSTGIHNLEILINLSQREGIHVVLSGVNDKVKEVLVHAGIDKMVGADHICDHITKALATANTFIENHTPVKQVNW